MHRNYDFSLSVFQPPSALSPCGPISPCSVHFPSTVRLAALAQACSTRLSDWNNLGCWGSTVEVSDDHFWYNKP